MFWIRSVVVVVTAAVLASVKDALVEVAVVCDDGTIVDVVLATVYDVWVVAGSVVVLLPPPQTQHASLAVNPMLR